MLEKHYTVKEVAAALGVHKNTLLLWILSGKIKAIKAGHNWRLPESEVRRIMRTGVDDATGT